MQISDPPAPQTGGLEHQSSSSATSLIRSRADFSSLSYLWCIAISRCHSWGICEDGRSVELVPKYLQVFFPSNHIHSGGFLCSEAGWQWVQKSPAVFLPHSWSCMGDKVAARPLKNNILNVIEGKIIRKFSVEESETALQKMICCVQ